MIASVTGFIVAPHLKIESNIIFIYGNVRLNICGKGTRFRSYYTISRGSVGKLNTFFLNRIVRQSEEPRHKSGKKISFYGTKGFLTCFSISRRKPHSKIPKTHLFTAFWRGHSWKFSKMKVIFLNFLEILFQKDFHFTAQWSSWHVSPSIPKNRTQKYSKLTYLQHFEVWHSWKFSKMKVFVFLNFLEISFSHLRLGS